MQEFISVKLSEPVKHNVDLLKLSPKGHAIAVAVQRQLFIRDFECGHILQKFLCMHSIDFLKWSPNSELICCGLLKKNIVQVWLLKDPSWNYKIDEAYLNIIDLKWSPDSQYLLIINEFHIKLTIWPLVSKNISVIDNPKFIKSPIIFSPCGKYLVVSRRQDYKDSLDVYTCDTWELIKSFVPDSKDLSEIQFSPNNLIITILESMLEGYKALFYSIDGRKLGKYCIDSINFGIKLLAWSPNERVIAIGDYDEKIKLLNVWNYDLIIEFELPDRIISEDITVYKIADKSLLEDVNERNISTNWEKYEKIKRRPLAIPCIINKSDETKIKHPMKHGIQKLHFSSDGHYMVVINGNMPKVAWIFDLKKLSLSDVLIHNHAIKCLSWHPKKTLLAISVGSGTLYMWTPRFCITTRLLYEEQLIINNMQWNSQNDSLILNSKGYSLLLMITNF